MAGVGGRIGFLRESYALFSLIEMLRRYLQIADGEEPEKIQLRVAMHVADLDNFLRDAIPPILILLGVLQHETQS